MVNVSGRSPLQDLEETGGNINLTGLNNWMGVLAWKRGALLVSFVWVAMLVMVIDRKWKLAALWAMIGSAFALFGIIHVPEAGFENFTDPVWEQCSSYESCWEYAQQWMFFTAYLMLAATFVLIELAREYGGDSTLKPPVVDDETEQGFANWFAEAHIDTTVHKHGLENGIQDPDVTTKTAKGGSDIDKPLEDDVGEEIDA